jgi:hypothetical protein
MSLVSDIQAVRANGSLSDAEKRAQVYAIKCNAIIDRIGAARPSMIGRAFTVGELAITLTQQPTYDAATGRLTVWVSAKRNGVDIVFPPDALPFMYVNPPVIHNSVESPLDAAKQMIAETVSRFG